MVGGLSMAVESDPAMRGHSIGYGGSDTRNWGSGPSAPYVDTKGNACANLWVAQPLQATIDPLRLPPGIDESMIRQMQLSAQSVRTINWQTGAIDKSGSMYALPDPIVGSTHLIEVRRNAARYLELQARSIVVAHMPSQLVSLAAQGPSIIRDLVLVEKFVADGLCNAKDHFTPTQFASLCSAGLGITRGALRDEVVPPQAA